MLSMTDNSPDQNSINDQSEDRVTRLFGNLNNLSEDELRAKVRQVRQDRRVRKEKTTDRKKRIARSNSARDKAEKLLASMTPEQLTKLMGD
jgi:hypothetical protein